MIAGNEKVADKDTNLLPNRQEDSEIGFLLLH